MLLEQRALAEVPWPSLRAALFAGEVFPMAQLRAVLEALPHAKFYNLFGPTETNVCSAYALPPILDESASAIPIGRPVPHIELELLSPDGQLLDGPGQGELIARGPGVMTGYWRRPELDTLSFVSLPDSTGATSRWYRTGDLARRDDEGLLWFLGRRDHQVKIRGFRVELGEVAAAVAKHPAIRESVVVPVKDAMGASRLHTVAVLHDSASLDLLALKVHCARHLPPYMVPSSLEVRSELPRTATGKIDLQRLVSP